MSYLKENTNRTVSDWTIIEIYLKQLNTVR
jgi:hypothetical protein